MAKTYTQRATIIQRTFTQRFIKERAESGYTQRQLAAILGVSQEIIAAYERERAMPTANGLAAIALLFRVSVDYLLGLHQSRQPYTPAAKEKKR